MSTALSELEAGGYEKITLNGTATGFTQAKIRPSSGDYAGKTARKALVIVEGGSIRCLETGDTPTSTMGMMVFMDGIIEVSGLKNLENFKAINVDEPVDLWVTYYFPVVSYVD